MRRSGETPKRTHKVDRTGLKRRNNATRYAVDCRCMTHVIGATRARRLRYGTQYKCRKCGGCLDSKTLRTINPHAFMV
jgi:predicted SprT family Zn-dependent metalloprotease